MAARVTDLETGTIWELLATPETDASRFSGTPWYRFRINCRSHAYVTIRKPWISKHHGGIDYRDGRWWANDGGSIHTVTVNGTEAKLQRVQTGLVDWEALVDAPAGGSLTARATDEAGNAEKPGHRLTVK